MIRFIFLMGLSAFFGVAAFQALSHEWYDPACCSDQDCARVSPSKVTAGPDGWIVELQPGDHPLVSTFVSHTVPYGDRKERQSMDGEFHACVHLPGPVHEGQGLICLYVPPMAF